MNNHLTPEQFSKWLIGGGAAEEADHLRGCPQCAAELVAFQQALSQFRSSVVNWADRERSENVPASANLFRESRQRRLRRLLWVPVAAVLAVVIAVPVYEKSIARQPEPESVQGSSLDSELLDRVNAHLSQTVPVSLQRLMELPSAENNSKSQGEQR